MEGSSLLTTVGLLPVSSTVDGRGPVEGRHEVAHHPSTVAWHKPAERELARGPTESDSQPVSPKPGDWPRFLHLPWPSFLLSDWRCSSTSGQALVKTPLEQSSAHGEQVSNCESLLLGPRGGC